MGWLGDRIRLYDRDLNLSLAEKCAAGVINHKQRPRAHATHLRPKLVGVGIVGGSIDECKRIGF